MLNDELSYANLVLGLIGTISGIVALLIHFWRLRRESPRLEAKVFECLHNFTVSKSKIESILFWAHLQIKNLGDRGTSINDVELTFEDEEKEYRLRKEYFSAGELAGTKRKWINAHDTIEIKPYFREIFEGNDKEKIDYTFTIYHTHGAEEIDGTSQKTEKRL